MKPDRDLLLDLMAVPFWLALAFVLAGCGGHRETGKALAQADQGIQAGSQLLASPEAKAILSDSRIPEDLRARWAKQIEASLALFDQARVSLAPGIALAGGGEPIQVDTTVEEAVRDPASFIRKAGRQAARAEVEVERLLWWQAVGRTVFELGQVAAGDWLSALLLGSGGAGGLLLTGLTLFRRLARDGQVKRAMVEYSQDVAQAATPEQVEAVKEKHAKRQRKQGIHAAVVAEVEKVKGPSTAEAAPG